MHNIESLFILIPEGYFCLHRDERDVVQIDFHLDLARALAPHSRVDHRHAKLPNFICQPSRHAPSLGLVALILGRVPVSR